VLEILLALKYSWQSQVFDISLEWKCWKSLTPKNFLQFFFPLFFLFVCFFFFFFFGVVISLRFVPISWLME
jgi:hypothetical protein